MKFANNYIEIAQAIELRNINKKSKASIAIALETNKDIKKLKSKLEEQVSLERERLRNDSRFQSDFLKQQNNFIQTQKDILEIQLREAEINETQRVYKHQTYKTLEVIEACNKISDINVRSYFRNNYLSEIRDIINEAKDNLNEFTDKEFCSKIFNKLDSYFQDNKNEYSKTILFDFEKKLIELSIKEETLENLYIQADFQHKEILNNQSIKISRKVSKIETEKNKLTQGLNDRKVKNIRPLRIMSIVFCAIMTLGGIGVMTDETQKQKSSLPTNIVMTSIFLFLTSLGIFYEIKYKRRRKDLVKKIKVLDSEITTINNSTEETSDNYISNMEQKINKVNDEIEILKIDLTKICDDIKIQFPDFFKMIQIVNNL